MSGEQLSLSFDQIYGESAMRKEEAKRDILKRLGSREKTSTSFIDWLSTAKEYDYYGSLFSGFGLVAVDGLTGNQWANLIGRINIAPSGSNEGFFLGMAQATILTIGYLWGGAAAYKSIKEGVKNFLAKKELDRNISSFLNSEYNTTKI